MPGSDHATLILELELLQKERTELGTLEWDTIHSDY